MRQEGRRHRLPENGCELHDDCLSCPLPVCIEEQTPEERKRTMQQLEARKTDPAVPSLPDRGLTPQQLEDQKTDLAVQSLLDRGLTLPQAVQVVAQEKQLKDPSSIYRRVKRNRQRQANAANSRRQR